MVSLAPALIPAAPQPKLLVFDLDGTLIDSRLDLAHAVNAALAALGRPALPLQQIARYVGNGAPMLMRRALAGWAAPPEPSPASDGPELPAALAAFLAYYDCHLLDHTQPYPGVMATLARLEPHYVMAVLTNKPLHHSQKILAGLGLARFFVTVYGGDSFATRKPDPEGLIALMRAHGARPPETWMIGDSGVDIQTGRQAGAVTCGMTYGLAPDSLAENPADYRLEAFAQLTNLLLPNDALARREASSARRTASNAARRR